MDGKFVDKQLEKLKNQININNDLKKELRKSFPAGKGSRWKLPAAVAAAAVICLTVLLYPMLPDRFVTGVNAASLKILNQVSFVDIGGGASVDTTEHNGVIYTAIFGKGLYAYDEKGFHKLYDKEMNSVSVSNDGKRIAFSDGSLKVLDLSNGKVEELLKSDDVTFYEEPSWSVDNKHIIYVKKVIEFGETHGFTVKQSDISEIDAGSLETKKLAEGSSPSYVRDSGSIVFERDGKVILKVLPDGTEKIVDKGRFPSVSPDGEYIAYVKSERKEQKGTGNVTTAENIDNVWIADVNLATKRQVTTNYVSTIPDGGAVTPDNGNIPVTIEKTGVYSYYNPSWSSDSGSLYVLKNNNSEQGSMRLARIDFSESPMTAGNTVRRFLQALVTRDDDYAKSLMENHPEILTVSNPHPVGYRILQSGKENGRDYVDAEIYSAYTAQPDYYITKVRYYLKPGSNGYIITDSVGKSGITLMSKDGRTVVMSRDKSEKQLFGVNDIPAEYLPEGEYRLASLAYNEKTDTVVFSIQALQGKGHKSAVKLISYDIKSKAFKLIDDIRTAGGRENIGIGNLVLDPGGNYAAVDLFSDDEPAFRSYVYAYDLKDNGKTELAALFKDTDTGSVHTRYWDEGSLVLDISSDGQTMSYSYDPVKGTLGGY